VAQQDHAGRRVDEADRGVRVGGGDVLDVGLPDQPGTAVGGGQGRQPGPLHLGEALGGHLGEAGGVDRADPQIGEREGADTGVPGRHLDGLRGRQRGRGGRRRAEQRGRDRGGRHAGDLAVPDADGDEPVLGECPAAYVLAEEHGVGGAFDERRVPPGLQRRR
jgi:hypothetical protein